MSRHPGYARLEALIPEDDYALLQSMVGTRKIGPTVRLIIAAVVAPGALGAEVRTAVRNYELREASLRDTSWRQP